MLRGLIIRQVFILVDLSLVVLVFFTAGLVVHRLFWPEPVALASTNTEQAREENPADYLQQVAARNTYDKIRENRMFGAAGQWSGKPAEPVAPVVDTSASVEETTLNLRLIGTLATFPKDPVGSANIENQDDRTVLNVALGEEILEGVTLEEVYPREVYILNRGTREKLSMDDEEDMQTASARPAPQPQDSHRPDQVEINRQEFIQDLYMNYADLVTKIKPEYHRDPSGKVIGLTAQNITQVPLAKKLNLEEGDVLTSVNNELIDSEQKVMEMIQKYRNSNSFRIGVLRNGKPHVITYRLN